MVSPSKKKSVRAKITNRCRRNAHLLSNQQVLPFQPLANLRFYLHLTGLKNLGEITAEIKHLGGAVEEFLSKEVHYVIVPAKPTPSSRTSVSPSTGDAASPSALPLTFSPCNPLPALVPSPNPPSFSPNTPSPHGGGSPDSTHRTTNSPSSAASLLSPLPPAAALSPHPPLDPNRRVTSRAAALLVRARFRQPGTSDVISNARRWGAQVWSVAKLQNYLTELAGHPDFKARGYSHAQKRCGAATVAHTLANTVPSAKPGLSSSRLAHSNSQKVNASTKPDDSQPSSPRHTASKPKKAFIKLEDFSKKYRPLFKEISNWPVLNIDSSRTTCPFAEALPLVWPASSKPCTPRAKKQNCEAPEGPLAPNAPAAPLPRDGKASLATPNRACAKDEFCSTPQAAARGASRSRRNSGGYCELCRVQYTSLRTHLLSTSHQSFVTDASNYGELDRLISEVHDQQARASLQEHRGRPLSSSDLMSQASPDVLRLSHRPRTSVVPPTHSQQP